MITTILLYIFYYAIYAILSVTILLLPDVTINANITSAIATILPYAAVINLVLPLDTIFTIFAASIVIFLLVALYRAVLWVIKLIRG
jgi:hypothetical protein